MIGTQDLINAGLFAAVPVGTAALLINSPIPLPDFKPFNCSFCIAFEASIAWACIACYATDGAVGYTIFLLPTLMPFWYALMHALAPQLLTRE